MLCVYVAGRVNDAEGVIAVQNAVLDSGHHLLLDWLMLESLVGERNKGIISALEVDAARRCDVLVLVPGDGQGVGNFIEVGAALGNFREVWVVGEHPRRSVFWSHPLVTFVDDIEALKERLSV